MKINHFYQAKLTLLILLFSLRANSQTYFPIEDFKLDSCEMGTQGSDFYYWFKGELESLNEPSIYESSIDYPIYRFTWMPSFTPTHVVTIHFAETPFITWKSDAYKDPYSDFHIEKWTDLSILTDEEYDVFDSLRLTDNSPLEINALLDKEVFVVNKSSFARDSGRLSLYSSLYKEGFARMINDLGFWEDSALGPCFWREGFTDGSEWLFEAKVNGTYKFVSRAIPSEGSKYYLLGIFFLKAAELEFELYSIY